ncbi:hypothetical protein [Flectobacillus major]|uniref:hypothetical protein n=1 Tax=Flectobacillus major TaxID=103 RepID=UPI000409AF4A|nr:hypothetical protein [Flectobacillus major]
MNKQDELGLLDRIQAPTPKLFKSIRNVAIVASAIALALVQSKQQGVELPSIVDFLASKIVVVSGAIAGLIAQLTVDYSKLQEK